MIINLYKITLLGLAATTVCLIISEKNDIKKIYQDKKNREIADQYKKNSEELKGLISNVNAATQSQTAILSRVIGKNIDVSIPPDIAGKISEINQLILNRKLWPKNEVEANALHQKLQETMNRMPVWIQEDQLPEINKLRWTVGFFNISNRNMTTLADKVEVCEQLGELAQNTPENAPDEIVKSLSTILKQLQAGIDEEVFDNAMSKGREALNTGEGIKEAIAGLRHVTKTEARDLMNRLVKKSQNDEIEKRVISITKDLKDILTNQNPNLTQLQLNRLMDDTINLQIEASNANSDKTADIKKTVIEISKQIEANNQKILNLEEVRYAEKQRAYQKWTLDQIKNFEVEYWYAEESAKNNGLNIKGVSINSKWGDAEHKRIMSAMTSYLLPISENLLDRPVSEMYVRSFNKAWKRLEDTDVQTDVAMQCAVVKKKTITDMDAK